MKKISIIAIVFIIIIGGVFFYAKSEKATNKSENNVVVSDPRNTSYSIDGEIFTLTNGTVEKEIVPDSATKNVVTIYGDPVFGDIDGDGDEDAVVVLINNPGGSGEFYYAALAVNVDGTYIGTDTMFLGDRIIPESFYIENNRGVVNYLARNFEDSFVVEPSVEKTVHMQYDKETMQLIQVAVDFEGESDSAVMELSR